MIGEIGQRVVIGPCELISRSHYESRHRDITTTVWRHVFKTKRGEKLVYSGRLLFNKERCRSIGIGDSDIYIKGTIFRHEDRFNMTRLKRVRIFEREKITLPL